MEILQKIRLFLQRLLRLGSPRTSPRQDFWADQYAKLILRQGRDVSDETLASARNLGLNVKALIAEHDRLKAASWRIEFSLDLAGTQPDVGGLAEKLKNAGIPSHEIETHGRPLALSLCQLYKRIDLPDGRMSVIDVIALGVASIHQRIAEVPEEFPSNRFPNGVDDWKLDSLSWSEAEQSYYLSGYWKLEIREKLPAKLCPESSVDLRRSPPTTRKLDSARPMPELKNIFLHVWRWPDGRHVVMDIFAKEEACPAPRKSPHPEQADTLRLVFPSDNLPTLEWKVEWMNARTPAMDFLFRQRCQELGKASDWLHPWTREALFEDYETTIPATDLRASLKSGPAGPAPLPKDTQWPCCPCCGQPALFSQSVDTRDIGFSDLLPGTTMVIFVCNDCLEDGQWQNCSVVVWLGRSDEVVLLDQGSPAPVLQRAQWLGAEIINDFPSEVQGELEAFQKTSGVPSYPLPASFGTKVGGFPAYLQTEEVFYDRDGLVMEYIAQISTPEHISAGGFGYVSYSAKTGETYIDFQDT